MSQTSIELEKDTTASGEKVTEAMEKLDLLKRRQARLDTVARSMARAAFGTLGVGMLSLDAWVLSTGTRHVYAQYRPQFLVSSLLVALLALVVVLSTTKAGRRLFVAIGKGIDKVIDRTPDKLLPWLGIGAAAVLIAVIILFNVFL